MLGVWLLFKVITGWSVGVPGARRAAQGHESDAILLISSPPAADTCPRPQHQGAGPPGETGRDTNVGNTTSSRRRRCPPLG